MDPTAATDQDAEDDRLFGSTDSEFDDDDDFSDRQTPATPPSPCPAAAVAAAARTSGLLLPTGSGKPAPLVVSQEPERHGATDGRICPRDPPGGAVVGLVKGPTRNVRIEPASSCMPAPVLLSSDRVSSTDCLGVTPAAVTTPARTQSQQQSVPLHLHSVPLPWWASFQQRSSALAPVRFIPGVMVAAAYDVEAVPMAGLDRTTRTTTRSGRAALSPSLELHALALRAKRQQQEAAQRPDADQADSVVVEPPTVPLPNATSASPAPLSSSEHQASTSSSKGKGKGKSKRKQAPPLEKPVDPEAEPAAAPPTKKRGGRKPGARNKPKDSSLLNPQPQPLTKPKSRPKAKARLPKQGNGRSRRTALAPVEPSPTPDLFSDALPQWVTDMVGGPSWAVESTSPTLSSPDARSGDGISSGQGEPGEAAAAQSHTDPGTDTARRSAATEESISEEGVQADRDEEAAAAAAASEAKRRSREASLAPRPRHLRHRRWLPSSAEDSASPSHTREKQKQKQKQKQRPKGKERQSSETQDTTGTTSGSHTSLKAAVIARLAAVRKTQFDLARRYYEAKVDAQLLASARTEIEARIAELQERIQSRVRAADAA